MKPVQLDGILADMRVHAKEDILMDFRELIVRRKRDKDLVADPVHIDHNLPGILGHQQTAELSDHRPLPFVRCRRRAEWWWQIATASASAASDEQSGSSRPRSDSTICWTWRLPAAPYPVTALFTCSGVYSAMASPPWAAARRATPLTCPSLKALCAFFANTRVSMATQSG